MIFCFQVRHVANQVEFATGLTSTQLLFLFKALQGFITDAQIEWAPRETLKIAIHYIQSARVQMSPGQSLLYPAITCVPMRDGQSCFSLDQIWNELQSQNKGHRDLDLASRRLRLLIQILRREDTTLIQVHLCLLDLDLLA